MSVINTGNYENMFNAARKQFEAARVKLGDTKDVKEMQVLISRFQAILDTNAYSGQDLQQLSLEMMSKLARIKKCAGK